MSLRGPKKCAATACFVLRPTSGRSMVCSTENIATMPKSVGDRTRVSTGSSVNGIALLSTVAAA